MRLGGPLSYAGVEELRPVMGDGGALEPADVHRAVRLSWAVGIAALVVCALVARVRP